MAGGTMGLLAAAFIAVDLRMSNEIISFSQIKIVVEDLA